MDIEETDKIYKNGFKSGIEHSQPSPHTLKLFKSMDEKIDKMAIAINNLRVDIAKLPERIFEKGDRRYASKLSEKLIYGMVGTVLTLVLIAVVYLVLK